MLRGRGTGRLALAPGTAVPEDHRRFLAHPEIVTALRSGSGQGTYTYLRQPRTDRWIRVGARERRLLQALTGVRLEQVEHQFQGIFAPEEIQSALVRFRQLGLLLPNASAPEAASPSYCADIPPPMGRRERLGIVLLAVVGAVMSLPLAIWLQEVSQILGPLMLIVLSATAHEAGHALAGSALRRPIQEYRLGLMGLIPVLQIRLGGFWGLSKRQRLSVSAAGIVTQVGLAGLSLSVWMVWVWVAGAPSEALLRFAAVNIVLATVNLLPAFPLDGYWVLAQWLDRPNLKEESKTHAWFHHVTTLVLHLALGLWAVRLVMTFLKV